MTISELFRTAREAAGMSQEATARAAGVSLSTIQRTEGGKLQPTAETLFAIADALGVEADAVRQAVRPGASHIPKEWTAPALT